MNKPPRILLVDDQPDNLTLLKAILGPEGFETVPAKSGMEALKSASAREPDLVLLDVLMPGMDGFDVCRAIRERPQSRFTPIILVTALQEVEDRIRGLEAGADDFLSKPFHDELLIAKINALLRLKTQRDDMEQIRADFSNMVVHDLRAPVHSILGLAELVREGSPAGDPTRKLLDLIESSARKIDRLISDFLDISRLETGRLQLRMSPGDLCASAAVAVERFGPVARQRGVRVELQTDESPVTVSMDAERVDHVWDNILQNAVKFSPHGGAVAVRVTRGPKMARCTVEDEGPGLGDGADLSSIFEKYVQRDARQGGVGLGLYVSRRVVEAHGGRIWAENRECGGARFTFELKLVKGGEK